MPDTISSSVTASRRWPWISSFGPALHRLSGSGTLARCATFSVFALPVALLYGRVPGEVLIITVGLCFLLESATSARWDWLRSPWAVLSLAFWAWMLGCTIWRGNPHAIAESAALIRYYLLAAALEHWVLKDPNNRRYLRYVFAAVAIWIAIEAWQQWLFGTDLFGYARWSNGSLTGPFFRPRAGGTLQVLFLPGLVPPIMMLLSHQRITRRAAGFLLLMAGVITSLLINQDMPALLLLFGLCVAGLLIPRVRVPLLVCMICGAAFLAASAVVAPAVNQRLVMRFYELLRHFPESPYGLLFSHALAMLQAHPWTGLGYDGFRLHCMDPQYLRGSSWLPHANLSFAIHAGWLGGSAAAHVGCSIHPHNYWLQIASSAGFPSVALFLAMAVATLLPVGRRAITQHAPTAVALFAAAFVMFWPIASSTSLFTLPNAGWVFMTLGWALAEGRWFTMEEPGSAAEGSGFTAGTAGASQAWQQDGAGVGRKSRA